MNEFSALSQSICESWTCAGKDCPNCKRLVEYGRAVAEATAEYIFAPAKYRFDDGGRADIAQRAAERLKP